MPDWHAWHESYDDPGSLLSERLAVVRAHLSDALAGTAAGEVRLRSLCAGQGHDVLGVLPDHSRRDDVAAVLVEADSRNVSAACLRAHASGLSRVEVRQADAGLVASYADKLPVDVLLLCAPRLAAALPAEPLFTFLPS